MATVQQIETETLQPNLKSNTIGPVLSRQVHGTACRNWLRR